MLHGETLSWLQFGLSCVFSLICSLFLAVVFVTLQMRRDLQAKLDELWLASIQTFNETTSSRQRGGKLIGDGGRASVQNLRQSWSLSRRTVQFAVTDAQWKKLQLAMQAFAHLADLYANPKYEKYWQLYTWKSKNSDGIEIAADGLDFFEYASRSGLSEEMPAYDDFCRRKEEANERIGYMLSYDEARFDVAKDKSALPFPTQLEQAWTFRYLFPKACKSIAMEVFGGAAQEYRQFNDEWNQRNQS